MRLKINPKSDDLLTINNFIAAVLIAILLFKWPISKKLEKPINCQPKKNWSKLLDEIKTNIENVENDK